MFGFGKRKAPEPQKPDRGRRSGDGKERRAQNLAQLGFLGGLGGDDGDVDNLMDGIDVGDDDLEEELAMLLEGKAPAPRSARGSPSKRPNPATVSGGNSRGAKGRVNVDAMDDEDDDGDVDLDDPDLEAELGDILGISSGRGSNKASPMDDDVEEACEPPPAPPTMTAEQLISLLQERLVLYEKAKAAADALGDSAKSRRFTRGVKTLKEMLPKAKAGRVIDESEIPPVVSIGVIKKESPTHDDTSSQPVPQQSPPRVPPRPSRNIVEQQQEPQSQPTMQPAEEEMSHKLPEPLIPVAAFVPTPPIERPVDNQAAASMDPLVEARLKEYKRAAVTLKRQGNVQEAVNYLKLSKAIETAAKNGETINLDEYPVVESVQTEPAVQPPPPAPEAAPTPAPPEAAGTDPPAAPTESIFGAPPAPTSVMEALEQRLEKYKSEVEKANAASNSSKARRMGRIVKQYEEAITLYKKGKPVPFDELPTPPGFAEIPVGGAGAAAAVLPAQLPAAIHPTTGPVPAPSISPDKRPSEDSPKAGPVGFGSTTSGTSPSGTGGVSRSGKPSTKLTLQERQLQVIVHRQKQFKEAALNAKKRGDVNQAREFLRTAKGFDKLIQVAQAGLPVDMATLPAPPEAVAKLELEEADNFEVVSASDCIMPSGSAAEIYSKLEDDLKQQLKMCMRTRDHFKSIGDVGSANRFESMALESKRDLDALRLAMKKNSDIPKYHYENRIFSITECNTDVADDEIEISILQGFNYRVSNPSDVDTYVKVDLPYPTAEEVQTNKTHVVKDTNNPEYNATYKFSINRTARNFQRFVHRNGFKCEVWSKGGFLRGSTLIGTATVKLLPLETKCTLHDAFDVLEGRKVVGKLEVKVKVREPVLTKQITQKKEKWLSIDRA